MKKYFYLFISLLFILPISAFADGIENFYIDATVLSNGDVKVKESYMLSGSYNGFERIINYAGSTVPFDGSKSSFNGSTIYNGDSIIVNKVGTIDKNNYANLLDESLVDIFRETSYASKGDYGVYTQSNSSNGVSLLIYNPSSKSRAFYTEYTITNMAIVHNDIAELGFNIFTELREYIDNLEMTIHIPNNQDLLRVWAHGPLWGESKIIDNQTVKVTIQDVDPYTGLDTRIAFDKDVLKDSNKFSNVDALDTIIELETEKANLANQEREKVKAEVEKETRIGKILDGIKMAWLGGLIVIIYFVYKKHDKEYASTFKTKYFRDFPSDNHPTTVGYLIRKQINNDDLSASILMLIYKKVLSFKTTDKKNNYELIYHASADLSDFDKKLLEFLYLKSFEGIKDQEVVTLSELKRQAKSRYESFLRRYTNWKKAVQTEAKSKNFFESKANVKALSILYSVVGIFLGCVSSNLDIYLETSTTAKILLGLTFIASIVSLIYFASFTKRTKQANEEYHLWMGLKNFMKDFGTLDKKDLPDIVLWEKYLVYAVTLGVADKLAKTMEIRATELQEFNSSDVLFDYYYFNHLTSFTRSINHAVHSSVSAAQSARAAANTASSSSSSGGGFGGGFSGGGGSFGGGGGGGRF